MLVEDSKNSKKVRAGTGWLVSRQYVIQQVLPAALSTYMCVVFL
jgi:hypothetical protein